MVDSSAWLDDAQRPAALTMPDHTGAATLVPPTMHQPLQEGTLYTQTPVLGSASAATSGVPRLLPTIWEITNWYDGRDSYLLGPPPVEDQASCACKLPLVSRLLVVPPAEMTFGEVPGQIVPGLSPAAATYTTLDFEK